MKKDEIIDKLLIEHEVWRCGYGRSDLENCRKAELRAWLRRLEEK